MTETPPADPAESAAPVVPVAPADSAAPAQPAELVAPQHPMLFGVRRRRVVVVAVLVFLAAAIGIASLISVPYYAFTPGHAESVSGLIELPASKVHDHPGSILLTDVYEVPLRAITYPIYRYFNSQASVQANENVIGIAPVSEYNLQGQIDMSNAIQSATYVALSSYGYKVQAAEKGAQLYFVDPVSNAYQSLAVGDVVVGVDGSPVQSVEALAPLIQKHGPGDTLKVTFRPFSNPLTGPEQTASVTLGEFRMQAGNLRCYPVGQGTRYPLFKQKGYPYPDPCVGVETEQYVSFSKLPFPVTIDPQGIVGPSAGLAFTLGLINELDPYSLTGGKTVAATGTMSFDGAVGDVGGVPQKTYAVEDAGATVFFVPPQEYKTALAHANGSLKVVEVSTVCQAVDWLVAHGGRVPPSFTCHAGS